MAVFLVLSFFTSLLFFFGLAKAAGQADDACEKLWNEQELVGWSFSEEAGSDRSSAANLIPAA
jgi:hypothetical protein